MSKILKIVYEPNFGVVVPDNNIENYVDTMIYSFYNDDYPKILYVGSELIFNMFRVKVKENLVNRIDNIKFYYKGLNREMLMNEFGELEYDSTEWIYDKILNRLIGL